MQVVVTAKGDDEIDFIADIGLERCKQYRTGAIAETGDPHPTLWYQILSGIQVLESVGNLTYVVGTNPIISWSPQVRHKNDESQPCKSLRECNNAAVVFPLGDHAGNQYDTCPPSLRRNIEIALVGATLDVEVDGAAFGSVGLILQPASTESRGDVLKGQCGVRVTREAWRAGCQDCSEDEY